MGASKRTDCNNEIIKKNSPVKNLFIIIYYFVFQFALF